MKILLFFFFSVVADVNRPIFYIFVRADFFGLGYKTRIFWLRFF